MTERSGRVAPRMSFGSKRRFFETGILASTSTATSATKSQQRNPVRRKKRRSQAAAAAAAEAVLPSAAAQQSSADDKKESEGTSRTCFSPPSGEVSGKGASSERRGARPRPSLEEVVVDGEVQEKIDYFESLKGKEEQRQWLAALCSSASFSVAPGGESHQNSAQEETVSKAEHEQLQAKYVRRKRKCGELRQDLQLSRRQCEELESEVARLGKRQRTHEKELLQLRLEREALLKEKEEREREQKERKACNCEAERERRGAVERRLQELEVECRSRGKRVQDILERQAEREQQAKHKEAQQEALLLKLREAVANAEQEAAQEREAAQQHIQQLEDYRQELTRKLEERQYQRIELQKEIFVLKLKVEFKQKELDELQHRCEELENSINLNRNNEDDIQELKARYSALEERAEEAQMECQHLQEEKQKALSLCHAQQTLLQQHKNELTQSKHNEQATCASLRQANLRLIHLQDELTALSKSKAEEEASLSEQLEDIILQKCCAERELHRSLVELARREKLTEEQSKELASLREDLQRLQALQLAHQQKEEEEEAQRRRLEELKRKEERIRQRLKEGEDRCVKCGGRFLLRVEDVSQIPHHYRGHSTPSASSKASSSSSSVATTTVPSPFTAAVTPKTPKTPKKAHEDETRNNSRKRRTTAAATPVLNVKPKAFIFDSPNKEEKEGEKEVKDDEENVPNKENSSPNPIRRKKEEECRTPSSSETPPRSPLSARKLSSQTASSPSFFASLDSPSPQPQEKEEEAQQRMKKKRQVLKNNKSGKQERMRSLREQLQKHRMERRKKQQGDEETLAKNITTKRRSHKPKKTSTAEEKEEQLSASSSAITTFKTPVHTPRPKTRLPNATTSSSYKGSPHPKLLRSASTTNILSSRQQQ